jgi:hypothetical protein
MRLNQYFKVENIKPTPWAEKHNISSSVISRYLNGRAISPKNAQKIEVATGGKVNAIELLFGDGQQAA